MTETPRWWHALGAGLTGLSWLAPLTLIAVVYLGGSSLIRPQHIPLLIGIGSAVRVVGAIALIRHGTWGGLPILSLEGLILLLIASSSVYADVVLFLAPSMGIAVLAGWSLGNRRTYAGGAFLGLCVAGIVPSALAMLGYTDLGSALVPLTVLAHWIVIADFCLWFLRDWLDDRRSRQAAFD